MTTGISTWRLLVLAIACAVSLAGCTSSNGTGGEPPRPALSWLGATSAELQQGYGQPDSVAPLPEGGKIMTYRWSRTETAGGFAVANGGHPQLGTQYVPTQTVSMNCLARFVLGADDHVREILLQGNGCWADHR